MPLNVVVIRLHFVVLMVGLIVHHETPHYSWLRQMIFSVMYFSFETQRNGLVFIYDMAGSNYTHFELDLSKKILNMLKVS